MSRSHPFAAPPILRRQQPVLAPVALLLTLASCLSSAPPAPPIRHFDPLPANPIPGLPPILRLTAAPHLSQEIAVRTSPRELRFDGLHHWLATPRDLLAAALGPALGPANPTKTTRPAGELHLATFELDLQQGVRARVELHWAVPATPLQVIRVEVPAVGRDPQQAAEAMAAALAQALEDLAVKG